jgi:hypothetical protein
MRIRTSYFVKTNESRFPFAFDNIFTPHPKQLRFPFLLKLVGVEGVVVTFVG